jgi:hypothetical protein
MGAGQLGHCEPSRQYSMLSWLTNQAGYRRTIVFLVHRDDIDDICYDAEGIRYVYKKLKESTEIPGCQEYTHHIKGHYS